MIPHSSQLFGMFTPFSFTAFSSASLFCAVTSLVSSSDLSAFFDAVSDLKAISGAQLAALSYSEKLAFFLVSIKNIYKSIRRGGGGW